MSDARAFILDVRSQALLAQAIASAAALGIADALAAGPMAVAELADHCGAKPDPLCRLLRTLAGHGIFAEDDDGRFALTDGAQPLRSDRPDSLYPLLAGEFPSLVWATFGELEAAIRTGDVAFERAHGAPFFDYLAANPRANASFDRAMALVAATEHPLIAASYDFARFGTVADIGGGQGGLLAAILGRYPEVRGLLFDQPQVIDEPAELQAAGLLERCELVGGDFFASVPAGADLYLLKRILHDWDDAEAIAILRSVRAATGAGGRLAVIDAVMRPGNAPDPNKDLDLNIMALTGGRERTEAEFVALFAAAGFALDAVRPLPPPATLSIVEARPQ
ncbi:MAG: hypothetical protein JSV45_07910 [Chromatiales bacterium]|nr:MAG: hypothetical protein JSV45_07910 [Chromatiales bacterium]